MMKTYTATIQSPREPHAKIYPVMGGAVFERPVLFKNVSDTFAERYVPTSIDEHGHFETRYTGLRRVGGLYMPSRPPQLPD